ncbi:MAG: DUF4214 domain-containing protein [Sulfitobacter sp.]
MENEFEIFVLSYDSTLTTSALSGEKFSVSGQDAVSSALAGSGAAPVAIAQSEFYAALQTGVVDAAASTDAGFLVELALFDSGLSLYRFGATQSGITDRALISSNATFSTDADEAVVGTAGRDEVYLLDGNDSFESRGGADLINGGAGTDTAIFAGDAARHTVTLSQEGVQVENRATPDGISTLRGIEVLQFAGSEFDLGTFGGLAGLSGPELTQFIELYIAYFNRAPDAVGLSFWGTAFANGTTLEQSAALFIDQDETRAVYPESLSNTDFVTAVYTNVLGRVADQVGFDFWVGVLNGGSVSRDQFILEILRGAKADPPPGADQAFIMQQAIDQKFLGDKTDLGTYFAVTLGMSDVSQAAAAMTLFDGSAASLNTAVAAINGFYADAVDAGSGAFLLPLVGVLDNPFAVPSITDLPDNAQTPMQVDLSVDGTWSTTDSALATLASIEVAGDADWIGFVANSGSNYRITLQSTEAGSDLDFDVRLLNTDGFAVAQGVQSGSEDFNFFPSEQGQSQFYFEVTAFADRAVVVGDYVLTVTEIA